jgi:maltose alpha-D-glucosyltransferase/alpha-amylase
VWSDDPNRYAGTRIIFTDTEKSNWTWDEVAQQYFWHRFFSHQPDLNFDNPAVLEAVMKTLEFWLEIGVDGFRLDAVPYLIEREGTSNENLRETHAVIKAIRARIDARHPGRLLLAEANMWPEDVREYFGDGDECQMAYHFPLMPRMYMAIAQEDRHPVVEILAQTPELPPRCQWAVFLRNHDELTLEMVTSKERDYMYRMYATDARARINLGIRRRLAPLLENDRARIELMNGLLLSMPGTPVLYYGDEIGMGDNIFLGDRDGVRTPMQWTTDRNGGFSRADPQRLYLPPIQDPIYGFEAVNVEAQSREPASLLNWTRRLLAVRNGTRAFGRGSLCMLHPGNRKVLAYVREHEGEVILCVFNLGRSAQPVELALESWKGRVPVEMLGRNAFLPIGERPYVLTLPAHGFFWLRLSTDASPPHWHAERLAVDELPVLVLFDGWNSLFRGRVVPWRMAMAERTRAQFERELMPAFLRRQRWYVGKGEPLHRAVLAAHAMLESKRSRWLLALVDAEGPAQPARYFAPLALAFEDEDEERTRALAELAVARVRQQASMGVLADAVGDEAFCRAVVEAIGAGREIAADGGALRFVPTAAFDAVVGDALEQPLPLQRLTTSSHSVSLLGDRLFLKTYRHLQAGLGAELEMGRFLTDVAGCANAVPVAGSIEFHGADGRNWVLALLQAQIANQGNAWSHAVDHLARMLESAGQATDGPGAAIDAMAERMRLLAHRVAQLHAALARAAGLPDFDPLPLQRADIAGWSGSVAEDCRRTLGMLGHRQAGLPGHLLDLAVRVCGRAPALAQQVADACGGVPPGLKTRLHGDLHLRQVLVSQDDFVIVGFSGGAHRGIGERRARHSALRDVASLLRSFDGARHAALSQFPQHAIDAGPLAAAARRWERRMHGTVVRAYGEAAVQEGLYADLAAFEASRPLLALFELEEALRELRLELDHRPEGVGVPLAAIALITGMAE